MVCSFYGFYNNNGQSKYCINGPKFTYVVTKIIASLFDKNILMKCNDYGFNVFDDAGDNNDSKMAILMVMLMVIMMM